ncbi:MAG: GumC family protein [Paracoccaceae bacterium]
MDLRFYATLFLRRLHWFILAVILCSAIGITLARVLPTVYSAEARLVVESEQIPDELAASTVRTQATEQLQIIQQRILTRDILIEMSNRLGIYASRVAEGKKPLSAEEIVADLRERISIRTVGSSPAQRRGDVQATIVTVGFNAPTSALAATVTNEVVTLILREDVSMRTGVARQTLEFFEQEVSRLDRELAQKAAVILEFKERNLTALPDSLDFRRTQQAAAQERLLQVERGEAEVRDRRARLVRLHEASSTANEGVPVSQRTPEQAQLQTLRDEMSRSLAVLSPDNPKIKLLVAQIAALEKVVEGQIAGAAIGEDGQRLSAFDVQLADLDGQLAFLAQQKAQIQSAIDALSASIAATPSNAVSLETLERDYSATRQQYDQAVQNKAKAETGDMIEALSKGQRITVIEQAIAPREPTSPNRPLIAAGGVGGGLFLGLALVALLEFFKAGIRRPVDLSNGLGITPFATLPYMRSKGEVLRQALIIWGGIVLFLLVIAATLWLVHTRYMPLDLLLEQTRQRLS